MFPDRSTPRQDDGNTGCRNIDAFVQNFAGHDNGISAGVKSGKDIASFLDGALVRDGRNEEFAADAVNRLIICGENDRPVVPVLRQKFSEQLHFCAALLCNCPLSAVRMQCCSPFGASGSFAQEIAPSGWRAETDMIFSDEIEITSAIFVVFAAFIGRKFDLVLNGFVIREIGTGECASGVAVSPSLKGAIECCAARA